MQCFLWVFTPPHSNPVKLLYTARGLNQGILFVQAFDPSGDRTGLLLACGALLVAAFLPPLWRTVGFVGIGSLLVYMLRHVVDASLLLQCLLYVAGSVCFIR